MSEPKSEFEQEMLATLKAIRETLGDIRRDLAALRRAQERPQQGVVEDRIVGGNATFSPLTRNKVLPKRLG
jgi:hypothetical protein